MLQCCCSIKEVACWVSTEVGLLKLTLFHRVPLIFFIFISNWHYISREMDAVLHLPRVQLSTVQLSRSQLITLAPSRELLWFSLSKGSCLQPDSLMNGARKPSFPLCPPPCEDERCKLLQPWTENSSAETSGAASVIVKVQTLWYSLE